MRPIVEIFFDYLATQDTVNLIYDSNPVVPRLFAGMVGNPITAIEYRIAYLLESTCLAFAPRP